MLITNEALTPRLPASPRLGGSASKGGLRPSRPCKPACDAVSDLATIRRLSLWSQLPVIARQGLDGTAPYGFGPQC